jgi:LysM repeat protein
VLNIRGPLQWSLLGITVVSGVLAFLFARDGDGTETVQTTVPTTEVVATTTTIPYEPVFYTVQSGDSLFGIAEQYQVSMEEVMRINGITNPDKVYAGQVLELPAPTGFVPVMSSTTMQP